MLPHRRQPTRLHRPWDSPGKNTGVGCHFLLQCFHRHIYKDFVYIISSSSQSSYFSLFTDEQIEVFKQSRKVIGVFLYVYLRTQTDNNSHFQQYGFQVWHSHLQSRKSLEVLFQSVVVILVVSLFADLFVVSQEDGMDQT